MAKKLTKNQLRAFAVIHLTSFGSGIDGTALDNCDLDEDEIQRVVGAVKKLCKDIQGNLPQIYTSKKILEYVRKNFK